MQLPGFDPDEYNINRANSARIVRRLYGRDHEIAIETFDPQAVFSHGLEMRATGYEDHLFACLRQAPAKIPADTAHSQDGNPHAALLLFTSFAAVNLGPMLPARHYTAGVGPLQVMTAAPAAPGDASWQAAKTTKAAQDLEGFQSRTASKKPWLLPYVNVAQRLSAQSRNG
jgi:hypothetical protein